MGDLYSDEDYAWKRSGQVGNLYEDQDYNWKRSGKTFTVKVRYVLGSEMKGLRISTL